MISKTHIRQNTKIALATMWLVMFFFAMLMSTVYLLTATRSMHDFVSIDLGIDMRLSPRFLLLFVALSVFMARLYRARRTDTASLILAASLAFMLLIDGLGNALAMYESKWLGVQYDKYVHLLAPMATSFGLGYYFYARRIKFGINNGYLAIVLGVLLLFQFSVLFEIYEYFSDLYFGTDMVGGLSDTIIDITLNYIGCLISALILFFWYSRKASNNMGSV